MSATEHGDLRAAFRALAGGRIDALEAVWQQCARSLHNYAFALTVDQDEADDVLADVLARLPRQGWRLRWVRNPRAYLFAAVRNTVRSRAKRRQRREGLRLPPASIMPSLDSAAVRSAVTALPPEQREVVVLHLWGGLTFSEVAQVTGVPANTAASRYRYALAKLREALTEADDGR